MSTQCPESIFHHAYVCFCVRVCAHVRVYVSFPQFVSVFLSVHVSISLCQPLFCFSVQFALPVGSDASQDSPEIKPLLRDGGMGC